MDNDRFEEYVDHEGNIIRNIYAEDMIIPAGSYSAKTYFRVRALPKNIRECYDIILQQLHQQKQVYVTAEDIPNESPKKRVKTLNSVERL